MPIAVKAVSEGDYEKWVSDKKKQANAQPPRTGRDGESPLTPALSRGGEREQGVPVAIAFPLPLRERDRVRGELRALRAGMGR
jgi:hypothetical protein